MWKKNLKSVQRAPLHTLCLRRYFGKQPRIFIVHNTHYSTGVKGFFNCGFFRPRKLIDWQTVGSFNSSSFIYYKVKCLIWSVRPPATALSAGKQICHSLFTDSPGNDILLWFELGGRIEIIYKMRNFSKCMSRTMGEGENGLPTCETPVYCIDLSDFQQR